MSDDDVNYIREPLDPKINSAMTKLAPILAQALNPDTVFDGDDTVGYVLLVLPFGNTSQPCAVLSNSDRAGVLQLLKMQVESLEAGMFEDGPRIGSKPQ